MNKIALVYANSLFEIALSEKMDNEILSQIKVIQTALEQQPDFVKVLAAPMVTKQEKEQLIDNVFADKINRYLLNYIKVMSDRKAINFLQESFGAYEQSYNKHYNIEKLTATTAVPLSEEKQAKLKEKLEKTTGKKILLENKVDKAAIGGVVLSFSDTQIDSSVASKLAAIKEELTKI